MKWLQSLFGGQAGSSTPETIEQHQALLASWRKMLEIGLNLRHELGEQRTPTDVAVGIVAARAEIARLKDLLRSWGVEIGDMADELATADPQEVTHNLRLLEIHRRNLAQYLQQAQLHGERDAPPMIANGIVEARREITRLKGRLREWNAPVADVDGDE
ncbi:MAG: hypothetical protein ACJ8CR_16255 [Roseiflexaceae bacterium]